MSKRIPATIEVDERVEHRNVIDEPLEGRIRFQTVFEEPLEHRRIIGELLEE